ncbi:MAG TPA: cyclic nucleotide-binding domain-containing protein, partial [Anaerolineales bacterium]|nr:cyclic nucleotide-binding domain-containing protein [Anaerolineales bacterium]
DTETNLYYLQYGSLKALKVSPDGREQVLRFISAGEIFNEVGALAKRPNPATAIALEESGIWLIPRQALESIVLAHPRTALQILLISPGSFGFGRGLPLTARPRVRASDAVEMLAPPPNSKSTVIRGDM